MVSKEIASKRDLEQIDQRLSSEIFTIQEHIADNTSDIRELQTQYENLKYLPNTLANLDKTMVALRENLNTLNDKIGNVQESVDELKEENGNQNARISSIGNKGNVNIIDFLTDNFWKIIAALISGSVIIKLFMQGGV